MLDNATVCTVILCNTVWDEVCGFLLCVYEPHALQGLCMMGMSVPIHGNHDKHVAMQRMQFLG